MRILILSVFVLLIIHSCNEKNTPQVELETTAAEARQLVKKFGGTLKPMLKEHLQKDGPSAAIEVCRDAAPRIAGEISAQSGWTVKRVSHKPRNANARPDAWEEAALQHLLKLRANGADADTLEYYEMVKNEDGTTQFRYMKAQKTMKLCLTCHGSQISPDVAATIDKHYPQDHARGFHEGEIRGAFSLIKNMP